MDASVRDSTAAPIFPAMAAPPPSSESSMAEHFLRLLESKEHADVTFLVGQAEFAAHTVVLAARSPVFRAMLSSGPSSPAQRDGDAKRVVVRVDDTEPAAFGALLHFVYSDELPTVPTDGGVGGGGVPAAMRVAGELLGAADRYGVARMRMLCERALREGVVDAATAAAALAVADRHGCAELRAFCVEYLASPEVLKNAVGTDGFAELKATRPVVLVEVLEKVAAGWRPYPPPPPSDSDSEL
ncbi:hypothetical protein ACP70R_029765 [Stipagrostis hirtigluma subsp. patula]